MAKSNKYDADVLIQKNMAAQIQRQRTEKKPEPVSAPVITSTTPTTTGTPPALPGGEQFKLPEQEIPTDVLPDVEDWDYKTAKTDMQGKPIQERELFGLNLKPKGFTPFGDVYFGGGLGGWLKGFAYKLVGDEETEQATDNKWKKFWDTSKEFSDLVVREATGNAVEGDDVNKEMSLLFQGVGELFTAAGSSVKSTDKKVSTALGIKSPITPILNLTTATLGAVFDAFQFASEVLEKVLGVNKAMREYADKNNSIMPDLAFDDDQVENLVIKEGDGIDPNSRIELRSDFVNTVTRLFGASLGAYDTIRFFSAPGTFKEKTEAIESGWVEGRLLFSELLHPTVEAEYQRRAQAGEDPYLLAMELEDPWVELGGELLLDPFNLFGVAGKAKKIASTEAEALKVVEKSGALSDTKFIALIQETENISTPAQASVKMEELVDYVQDYSKNVRVTQDYSATALNAAGNQRRYHKTVGNFMANAIQSIRNQGGSPDDVLDYAVGLLKRSSDDRAVVKEGLAIIGRSPLRKLSYNQTGFEVGHILRQTLGDGDSLVRALQEAGTDWNKMRGILDGKIQDSLKFVFPSVSEMSKAADNAKILTDAGKIPDRKTLALTQQFAELQRTNPGVAKWSKVENFLDGIVGPINGLLANSYFSLNYGYAFRNLVQNFFTLAVDGGFSLKNGILPSTTKLDNSIIKMVGEIPPSLRGKTFNETMTKNSLFEKFFNKLNKMKFSPAGISDWAETYSSKLIYSKYFRKTMDDAMQFGAGLPPLSQWETAGFSKVQADDFLQILKAEDYNEADAFTAFNKKYGSGTYEKWKALDFVNPDAKKGLEEFEGFWGDIVQATKLDDQKDVLSVIDNLKTRVKLMANKSKQDVIAMSTDSPEWKQIADAQEIAGKKHFTDAMANEDIVLRRAARNALNEMDDALGTAAKKLSQEAMVEQNPQKQELASRIIDWLSSAENKKQAARIDEQVAQKLAWAQDLKQKAKGRGDLTLLWDEAVLGKRPALVNYDTLFKTVWDNYYGFKKSQWDGYYSTYLKSATGLAKEVGVEQLFAKADEAIFNLNQYRNMTFTNEGMFMKPPRLVPANVGTKENFDNIIQLAKGYGVPTASVKGKPMDKALNIINKYLRNHADDVDTGLLKGALNEINPKAKKAKALSSGFEGWVGGNNSQIMLQDGSIHFSASAPGKEFLIGGSGGKSDLVDQSVVYGFRGSVDDEWIPTEFYKPKEAELANFVERGYGKLDDVPADLAEKAFADNVGETVKGFIKQNRDGTTIPVEIDPSDSRRLVQVAPPHDPDLPPSGARVVKENQQGVLDALNHVRDGIIKNWGLRAAGGNADVSTITSNLSERLSFARARAMQVADKYRDFALLPYGETKNMDFAMSLVYPYQFWYSRSYTNWMKRAITTNPEIFSRYANLKDTMAKEHADLPDWWKYQVPFSLPGMEEPVYLNLEATIWPMYGLTGTDFNDPEKRTNWFTSAIDDMGKFGPTVWGPIQWAVAIHYAMNGEKDIAAKWGTRMIPQTATIKAISSYWGTPIELDPNIRLFNGDGFFTGSPSDPHEEGRISRALAAMENEDVYSPEELLEAARTHSGPAWEEAYQRAIQQRAPGQILSSLFGVGFKPRTADDIQTDKFYADYGRMRNLHDGGFMSDEDYKQGFNELREQYPFMDIILLSRRAGVGREAAYAYNVISRIPPGMTKEIYEIVGIDPETAQKFYDSGGKLDDMSETEQQRFITAMVDAGAILAIPSNTTRKEWTAAKNMYSDMQAELKKAYGEDISDKIGLYFGIDDKKEAKLFLDSHPEVGDALDDQNAFIANNKQLLKFYGGLDTIDRYYTGLMYDRLEKKFGDDITSIESAYFDIFDSKEKKAYKAAHPELQAYWDEKKVLKEETLRRIVQFGDNLPEAEVTTTENEPVNPTQKELKQFAQPEPQVSFEQWQGVIGNPMSELIQDYWFNDEDLPKQVTDNLDYMATQYGFEDGSAMLQQILMSLPQAQAAR